MPRHRYAETGTRLLWGCTFILVIPYWVGLFYGPSLVGIAWLLLQHHGEASPAQLALVVYSYALGVLAMLITSAGVILAAETKRRTARQVLLVDLGVFVASQILNLILNRP